MKFFSPGKTQAFSSAVLLLIGLTGCRGQTSSQPPLLPVRNMVDQTTYPAQSNNGKTAVVAPEGTVALDMGHSDSRVQLGKEANGQWVKHIPLTVTHDMLLRGQDRFNIYCAPCHGNAGHSDGLVTQRANGSVRPSDLHDSARLALEVGQIYNAVTNGVNNWNMPGFTEQMSIEDRWAVVAYVRALQLSEHATEADATKQPVKKN